MIRIRNGAINWRNPVKPGGLNDGLVSWWLARGPWVGGSTWFDLCGKNNGTLTNSAAWSPSSRTGGRQHVSTIKASSQYVSLPGGSLDLTGLSTYTLTAWVKTTATTGVIIYGYDSSSPFTGYSLAIGIITSGRPCAWCGGGGWTDSASTINSGTWQHVAATLGGGTVTIYINGVSNASASRTPALGYTGTKYIGHHAGDAAYDLTGDVDDLRVYGRCLSSGDIAQLYSDSLAGYPQTLNRLERRFGAVVAAASFNPAWARNATTLIGAGCA